MNLPRNRIDFKTHKGNILKTKLTETFGVKYPLVGGAMMSISYPEFVAAISNAGGLGILASAIYHNKEEFSDAIGKLKMLTDKPFAVNLNLFSGHTNVS